MPSDPVDGEAVNPEPGETAESVPAADIDVPNSATPDGNEAPTGVDLGDPDPREAAMAELESQRDTYLASLQQLKADFENYEKRSQRQVGDEVDRSVGQLVERLLPVLDNVALGVEHGVEGLAPIGRALSEELERVGLEVIDATGSPFDPHEHEAVGQTPAGADQGEPGSVGKVLRTGYRWRGRVLRPAMVLVFSDDAS